MTAAYEERLVAPVGWWVAVVGVAAVSAATIHSGAPGLRAVVPYVVLVPGAVLVMVLLSRGRVVVEDGVLHVPGARIALDHLGGVTPLDREGTRRVRGPLAEPRAYVATRPWLATSVRVQLEDPDDDTPYWLVGTRRPQDLAAVLAQSRGS